MENRYCNGLAEKALPDLHDAVFSELLKYAKKGTRVLDLGAGSGAWAHRLLDHGFQVVAVDLSEEFCHSEKIEFIVADLNKDFSERLTEKFSIITALEVIEHLENPRHFFRQISRLLRDDGVVLMTTPNIECIAGRLRFLWSGQFRMFGPDSRYNDLTHITPIHTRFLDMMLADAGFYKIAHSFNVVEARSSSIFVRVMSRLLSLFVRGVQGGDNHIFVIKKVK